MDLFSETLFDEINFIDEGSRIRPSITIIRGQNSAAISHRSWEISDCDFVIEI
jgi:hypothetical protein